MSSPSIGRRKPWLLKLRSSQDFISTTVSFAIFTDVFLYSFIVPIIPFSLESRVHVPHEKVGAYVSALIAAYGGALAAVSPLCGYFADHTTTRRMPFLLGLICLLGATVILHLGRAIPVLIIARILQGFSAAVVWIVGLALLADTVKQEDMGKATGWIFMSLSLGILLGPMLGGLVFDKGGYNAVFVMAYAIITFDILLRLVIIEKKVAIQWKEEENPPPGTELTSEDRKDEANLNPNEMRSSGVADVESSGRERPQAAESAPRSRIPPVITLLKSGRMLASLWGSVVLAIITTSFDSVLPLYVRQIFNWSSTGAGLIFLALCIPSFAGPLVGIATDKYGPRWIATFGFMLVLVVEVLLRFVTHNTLGQKVLLCALLALIGLSLDFISTPIMTEISSVVFMKEQRNPGCFGKKGAYAQAYSLFNLAYAIGCLVGPIWGGLINSRFGWGTMTWTIGLLSGLSAIPTALWVGGAGFWRRDAVLAR